jgi:hypothetical protein
VTKNFAENFCDASVARLKRARAAKSPSRLRAQTAEGETIMQIGSQSNRFGARARKVAGSHIAVASGRGARGGKSLKTFSTTTTAAAS